MKNKLAEVWIYISHLGIDPSIQSNELRMTRLINRISASFIILMLFSIFYQSIKHLYSTGTILPHTILMLPSFSPFVLILLLNKYKKYTAAKLVLVLFPLVASIAWMFVPGLQATNNHYSLLLFPIPIIIFFKELRVQLFLFILVYLTFVICHFISQWRPTLLSDYVNQNSSLLFFASWMVLAFVMLRFFLQEIEQAKRLLNQKNTELQDFVDIATHDLKEPLRTIIGFSKLLKRKHQQEFSEESLQLLDFIETGSLRMANLLHDLSNFSMVEKTNKELAIVDLNNVLKTVMENLQSLINKSNAKIVSNKLPSIKTNNNHMIQLFQNIISNSIKFQPLEANVSPQISILSQYEKGYFSIKFNDNGIGIHEENLSKIFNKFTKLHNKSVYDGTGLGLATCKKIATYYNGEISIESEVNVGTCITVKFLKSES